METIQLLPILPEIFLAIWGMLILLFATGTSAQIANRAMVMTFVGLFIALGLQWEGIGHTDTLPLLKVDTFSRFVGGIVLIGGMGLSLIARDFLTRHQYHRGEFYVLLIFCILGIRTLIIADSLLTLYVGLEMMSFCLYILAAFMRENAKSSEAGLKYFVLGSLASGVLLYGMSLLYGLTGDISYTGVAAGITSLIQAGEPLNPALIVAFVFILAGILFKLSVVPFHMWTPDVYEGAPTPVTAIMSTLPKLAAVALLMRVLLEPFATLQNVWQPTISLFAMLTMVGGSLLAIVQTNIKRLLAYSSIAQVGFLLVGIAAGTGTGFAGALFYTVTYIATLLGLFAVLLQLRKRAVDIENIGDFTGLGRTHPVLAGILLLCLFSLAGVPPLAGFFAKIYVFQAAMESGLLGLVIVGVLSSAVAVFYSLKLLKTIYFEKGEQQWDAAQPLQLRLVSITGAALTLGLFILPHPLWKLAMQAVQGWF
ncbi:MAG: NADH-quinone oxidoreductase subunit N [Alphaproteobacteria bacterium]|nr:NADH-quinone oxidoreductase subunit N [Alphaproteobacteria bacterium]MDD9919292.1 NADH-quinone oxidoreductase subunit N [Alphaproteobacteria bacterium]